MNGARFWMLISVVMVFGLTLLFALGTDSAFEPSKEPIDLYCAAGMKEPVEAICKAYQAEYGVPIRIQYGGSGTLLGSLRVAERADLYLAADESYVKIAQDQGLVRESIPLARMAPVIAVAEGNPKGLESLADLTREDIRLAIANPDQAAVGRVSREVLQESGYWESLKDQIRVYKPTVMDLANDLKLGTVDAAIVWDAVVNQYPKLDAVRAPEFEKGVQLVSVGVVEKSPRPTAALRLARYMSAIDRGLVKFKESGFVPVDGDPWEETPKVVLFSGGVNRLAIEETLEEFENREGVELIRNYNGCGILVSQMKAGDLPDAYFACDVSFMDNVGELFLHPVAISQTEMVILVRKGNPKNIRGLEDLARPGLKVGLANARQSALGKLTENLLIESGILEEVMKNVKVQSSTADILVNQMKVAASGEGETDPLDAVVVYEANCPYVKDELDIVRIERQAYAVQPYGITKQSKHKYLMARLQDALISRSSKEKFESVGFRWKLEETSE